jgi:hypothetical protein
MTNLARPDIQPEHFALATRPHPDRDRHRHRGDAATARSPPLPAARHHPCASRLTVVSEWHKFCDDHPMMQTQHVRTARLAAGGRSMVGLRQHGIRAVDLDRGPGAEDGPVLAVGPDRLDPIRTDPDVSNDRLVVVAHAGPPPSEDALTVLAGLVSATAITPTSTAASHRWAREAVDRILVAVAGRPGTPAVRAYAPTTPVRDAWCDSCKDRRRARLPALRAERPARSSSDHCGCVADDPAGGAQPESACASDGGSW